MRRRGVWFYLVTVAAALAQAPTAPVVNPRGVLNAFTRQPAPSAVAAGGILRIEGLNLSPPEGLKASETPLPTRLGDPPLEVLINGKPAPLFSARPDHILVQVPWDVPIGLATVVVRRGASESRPARVLINRLEPSLRTANDAGYGEVAGRLNGNVLTIPATGLGPPQPPVADGEPGPSDPPARPRDPVRAYVGGLPARVRATLSPERVGEFDVRIEIPPEAQPGDLITLLVGTRTANSVTFQKAASPEVRFLARPEDAPQFRSMVAAGLRGSYVIASGARGEDGCYPSYLFDFARQQVRKIDACLTAANANARTPVVTAADSPRLAALLGPPLGEAPAPVSSRVMIFDPAKEEPLTVELPEPVANLTALAGGDFAVTVSGTPPRVLRINGETGEIVSPQAAGATGAAGIQPAAIQFELDGKQARVLALTGLPQNLFLALIADDADRPTRARVVVVNREGETQGSRDFPEGWVPIVAPPRPQASGAAQPTAQLRRVVVQFDGVKQRLYVVARRTDDSRHGVVAFTAEDLSAKLIEFPEAWFVPTCSPTIPAFNLELARKLVLLGAGAPENEIKDPCPATGFLLLDLEEQQTAAVALPGQGQFDADPATTGDVNDFIYGANTDPARRNTADTLYVLDGVTASAFRLDLPTGVTSFANPMPLPMMNAVIALATNRMAGDAGFVYFDLENAEARLLPTPEGFAQVNFLSVFTATRKLIARGIKTGGTGSQYLIYDLATGDLLMPPNPERVAWVGNMVQPAAAQAGGTQPSPGGAPPGQGTPQPGQGGGTQPGQGGATNPPGQTGPIQPGQGGTTPTPGQTPAAPAAAAVILQQANPRANTITAAALDGQGRQLGLLLVSVP